MIACPLVICDNGNISLSVCSHTIGTTGRVRNIASVHRTNKPLQSEHCCHIMSADASLTDKEAFYSQLGWLDAKSGSEDEITQQDLELRQRTRKFFKQALAKDKTTATSREPTANRGPHVDLTTPDERLTGLPGRSNTAPTPLSTTVINATPGSYQSKQAKRLPGRNSFIQDTPRQSPPPSAVANLRRMVTIPSSLLPTHPSSSQSIPDSSMGSRKRKHEAGVPLQDQVLRGLRFFYIQGDRKGLRKLRMEQAERHGAELTSVLADATHVIVDDDLTFEHIKDGVASVIGQDRPLIVRTHWPLDSIKEKRLLPTTSSWYRVIPDLSVPTAEDIPRDSLEVKAARNDPRRQANDPHVIPSQSEKSSAPQNENRSEVETWKDVTIPSSQPFSGDGLSRAGPASNRPTGHDYKDELSRMIEDVRKNYKDLPSLACDEDEGDKKESDSDSDSDSGSERRKPRKRVKKSQLPKPRFEDKFACSRGGTMNKSRGPNAKTVAILQQLCDYYDRINDHFRLLSYRRAINVLSMQAEKVKTADEAELLPCIGPSISRKIEEIVKTDRLQRLEHAQNDPKSQVLQLFLGIYGVGLSTASQWMAQGFETLNDLLRHAPLTPNQRIGIEHYQDLNSRIPRSEVKALGDYVKDEAARIDMDVELLIGGSYRRGADSSGDIDFIITKAGTKSSEELTPFLDRLVTNLTQKGFLTVALASHDQRSSKNRDDSGSKWHGCCVLPREASSEDSKDEHRPWRRIDFLLVYVETSPRCMISREIPHKALQLKIDALQARDRVRCRVDLFHGQ